MIGKIFKWIFLLCLVIVIFAIVSLQTDYIQNKLAHWVEKKTEGALTIGKFEGILPLWIHLKEVCYQTEDFQAYFDDVKLFFSPTLLLFGKIVVTDLQINEACVISQNKEWPIFPFPIELYSFRINHLSTADFQNVTVEGMASLTEDFFLKTTVQHPELPQTLLQFSLQANQEDKTVAITSNIQNKEMQLEAWINAVYGWKSQTLKAFATAKGKGWKGGGELAFGGTVLTSPDFHMEIKGKKIGGSFSYDLNSQQFSSCGNFLFSPFSLNGTVSVSKTDLTLSSFFLQYEGACAKGDVIYTFETHALGGAIDAALHDLSKVPLYRPLRGAASAHLVFSPEKVTFDLQASQLRWKDLYIPDVGIQAEYQDHILKFALAFHDFAVLQPAYEVFPNVHLGLQGYATKELISVNGNIWGLGEAPFTLAFELPIELKAYDLSINEEAPFSLHVQGKGSIDPVLAFLENASLIARGCVDFDLTAAGTWQNPNLTGHFIYDKGWIESLTTGALFRGIHMEMEGTGRSLQIRSLIAHDVDKGDLVGWGEFVWDPSQGFPFDFHLYASRYLFLAIDPFTASVNAEIILSGNVHEMTIAGRAVLVQGHLAIPSKMPVQVPVLEVCYLHPVPTPKPEIATPQKIIPIHWDLVVEAPRNFVIDGRGLNSEWCGTFSIKGEQNALAYKGNLELVQGRFSVLNRTFNLIEGQVRIEGLEPKDIIVDIKADYELPNITASLLITGSLDNTHLSFCSSPPLSPNQILSWIVFQQDINELTPFQACRLATLLVSLSGKYTGPKTFDRIKEGLGIDVFSITDCDIDSADLTFQVGKYLSEGTFVGINKSISGDFDSVIIQTRLYRNFFLEANYGGSLNGLTPTGGKVVFKWYKSY